MLVPRPLTGPKLFAKLRSSRKEHADEPTDLDGASWNDNATDGPVTSHVLKLTAVACLLADCRFGQVVVV